MTTDFDQIFPKFSALLPSAEPENILPSRSANEIAELEQSLDVGLPESYKQFLRTYGGLWMLGGAIQLGPNHPFFHRFPAYEELTSQQRAVVQRRGGTWPPPSQGMLCFAEYFLEADGDQVLFDVSNGLINDEYPVFYYAHKESPARVSLVADSFAEWIENQCIQSFDGS